MEEKRKDPLEVIGDGKEMTDMQYTETQTTLMLIVSVIEGADFEGMLVRIQKTHTLGPILDPTLYQRGVREMQFVEELARAARTFQKSVADARKRYSK